MPDQNNPSSTDAEDRLSFFADLGAQKQAELAGWLSDLVDEVTASHSRRLVAQMEGLKTASSAIRGDAWNAAIDACIALIESNMTGQKARKGYK